MEYNITEDFVGIFDDAISQETIDQLLSFYQDCEAAGMTRSRQDGGTPRPKHLVDDDAVELYTSKFFYPEINIRYIGNNFIHEFWTNCYLPYAKKYSILAEFAKHKIYDAKLQKISVGGGYHNWHAETMDKAGRDRLLAFMLYLNDVDEGGETEFLYLKKRFQPKANRLLLWPSGFTHTHRGNPPLSNDKMIVTGWIEMGV
jgi:hypothetical protein